MTTSTTELLIEAGLSAAAAGELAPRIDAVWTEAPADARWSRLSREVLTPELPHAVHQRLFARCYADWDTRRGPPPAWSPTPLEVAASNVGGTGLDWRTLQRQSRQTPEAFWRLMAQRLGVTFDVEADRVLDVTDGVEHARWFVGARTNIARAALAASSSDPTRLAVVVGDEAGEVRRYTLAALAERVRQVAGGLAAHGIRSGDAVAIDMPMTYDAVAAYLGIVSLGAVVVSIADSFAPAEIATRLRIAEARAIITQDVILRGDKRIPLYERVCEADAPMAIVVAARDTLAVTLRVGDVAFDKLLGDGFDREKRYAVCEADAPTNILFSSGTTGDPKAIAWTHLTPLKAAADGWAHHDIRPGDVVAWPTNLGWMMGPWLIYASLLNGAAIALYDGSPLERGFVELVQAARVTMLGVVPSLVRAWRRSGVVDGADWSHIRCFSSTGEASNPDDMLWLMARAGYKPVIEYCGGTEIGGGYIAGTYVEPQAPSAFSTPAIGSELVILDEAGAVAEEGELALVPPMLGSSDRLLNRDHHEVYFADMPAGPNGEVLRRHGDHVAHVGGGYHRALGRVDDTMNLGGIKTSSAEIERQLAAVPGVIETAAVAVSPEGGGPSELVIYAVLASGHGGGSTTQEDAFRALFQQRIRDGLNPLFKVADVVVVDALPRTASNKVMRRVLRDQYGARTSAG